MPTPEYSEILLAQLAQAGVSKRELGRRIYPDDPEGGRRVVRRWCNGKVVPIRATRDRISEALGLLEEEAA